MALRDDQRMAEALCDYCNTLNPPPKSLRPVVQRNMPVAGGFGTNRNIQHMAAALNFLLRQAGAELALSELVYRANREGVFRSTFEGRSVGYSGYQSLAWLAIVKCPFAPSSLRAEAREQLRQDLTVQSLCSTLHGRVVLACGRVYATQGQGVVVPATDYRVRAVRGISDDGWWPPKGVGPKFWTNSDSVSARPWRKDPTIPALLFSDEERLALDVWSTHRILSPVLLDLIAPCRVPQQLTIAAVPGGHLAWMGDLRSYGEGKNTAQPLVWAVGDQMFKAVIHKPPTGAVWDGSVFKVNGADVEGFPVPGLPQITFSEASPVVTA